MTTHAELDISCTVQCTVQYSAQASAEETGIVLEGLQYMFLVLRFI